MPDIAELYEQATGRRLAPPVDYKEASPHYLAQSAVTGKSVEEIRDEALERARKADPGGESTLEFIGREALPLAKGKIEERYREARKRHDKAQANDDDLGLIARYEAVRGVEEKESTGAGVVRALANVPKILLEATAGGRAVAGGKALLGLGRGATAAAEAAPSLLTRAGLGAAAKAAPGQLATGAATTPFMPDMYYTDAQQRATRNGGEWYDAGNLAPAVGYAVLQAAVLGHAQRVAGAAAKTTVGRITAGGAAGLAEQQAGDAAASLVDDYLIQNDAHKVGAKYGALYRTLKGEPGAQKELAAQIVTFGLFSGLQAPRPAAKHIDLGHQNVDAPKPDLKTSALPAVVEAVEQAKANAKKILMPGEKVDKELTRVGQQFIDLLKADPATAFEAAREAHLERQEAKGQRWSRPYEQAAAQVVMKAKVAEAQAKAPPPVEPNLSGAKGFRKVEPPAADPWSRFDDAFIVDFARSLGYGGKKRKDATEFLERGRITPEVVAGFVPKEALPKPQVSKPPEPPIAPEAPGEAVPPVAPEAPPPADVAPAGRIEPPAGPETAPVSRRQAMMDRIKAAGAKPAEPQGPPPGVLTDVIRDAGLESKTIRGDFESDVQRLVATGPDRKIRLRIDDNPLGKFVDMSFEEAKAAETQYVDVPKSLRKGTLEVLRDVRGIAKAAGEKGVGIVYNAESKRHDLYSRVLESQGFKLVQEEPPPPGDWAGTYYWQKESVPIEAPPGAKPSGLVEIAPEKPAEAPAGLRDIGLGLKTWVGESADRTAEPWMKHTVFISELFDAVKAKNPGLELEPFKEWLYENHGMALSRLDLPQTVGEAKRAEIGRSQMFHPSGHGEYHLVDVKQLTGDGPVPAEPAGQRTLTGEIVPQAKTLKKVPQPTLEDAAREAPDRIAEEFAAEKGQAIVKRSASGWFELADGKKYETYRAEEGGELVVGEYNPKITGVDFESFKTAYLKAFGEAQKYTTEQVGSRRWTDEMAEMSDARPAWVERIEAEAPKPAAPAPKPAEPAKMKGLKKAEKDAADPDRVAARQLVQKFSRDELMAQYKELTGKVAGTGRGQAGFSKQTLARAIVRRQKKLAAPKVKTAKADESLATTVQRYGGIAFDSELKKFFGSPKEVAEFGIPLNTIRTNGKGIDVLARELHEAGFLRTEEPQELLDALAGRRLAEPDNPAVADRALEEDARLRQEEEDAKAADALADFMSFTDPLAEVVAPKPKPAPRPKPTPEQQAEIDRLVKEQEADDAADVVPPEKVSRPDSELPPEMEEAIAAADLTDAQRTALGHVMRHVSLRDAGKKMGVSYQTVKNLADQASQKLRDADPDLWQGSAAQVRDRFEAREALARSEGLREEGRAKGKRGKPGVAAKEARERAAEAGLAVPLGLPGAPVRAPQVGGIPGIPGTDPVGGTPQTYVMAKAAVAKERQARGQFEKLAGDIRRSDVDGWNAAIEKNRQDPRWMDDLIDRIETQGHLPDPNGPEMAGLLLKRTALGNAHAEAERQLVQAQTKTWDGEKFVDNADPAVVDRLRTRAEELGLQRDRLDGITRRLVGAKYGRGLRMFRLIAKEDYSLAGLLRSAEAAKGKPLTEPEKAQVVQVQEKIAAAEEALAKAEAAAAGPPGGQLDITVGPAAGLEMSKGRGGAGTGLGRAAPDGEPGDMADLRIALKKAKGEAGELTAGLRRAGRPPAQKAASRVLESMNVFRVLQTAFDLSGLLRQGGFFAYSRPGMVAKGGFPDMFKAALSERALDRQADAIEQRANFPLYQRANLFLADVAGSLNRQEESYASKWADLVPGVKASKRGYTAVLNRIRADAFDALAPTLFKDGKPTDAEVKWLGNFVNTATGRGSLKNAKADLALGQGAAVLFSPRYLLSRMQLISGQPIWSAPTWRTRGLAAKEYARSLMGVGAVYALASMLNEDEKITFDPRSSDFGKVQFGNTRMDPLIGLSQLAVFGTRSVTGETVDAKGKAKDLRDANIGMRKKLPKAPSSEDDVFARFLRSKLAPVPGAFWDLRKGTTPDFEKATPAEVGLNLVMPFGLEEIYKEMKDQGAPRNAALALLAILGMGVQVHQPKKPKAG